MRFLITLLINGLLVYATSAILSGVTTDSYLTAVIVALLLAFVNTFIKPVLTLLTLPLTILTLGIFLLFVNGAMVLIVDWLIAGFSVSGWGSAILFALIMAIFNLFIGGYKLNDGKKN